MDIRQTVKKKNTVTNASMLQNSTEDDWEIAGRKHVNSEEEFR